MVLTMSAIGVTKPASVTASRRRWLAAVVFFVLAGVAWVGWTWWTVRRYRSSMAEIDAAMAAGRFGLAARNLENLLAWNPSADEAAYALGICEQARGRTREADQAWARVSPGSAFTQRAILARLRLFHDTGRLAAAEQVVIDAANDPRNDGTDLLVLLVPIYSQIGRSGDAEQLVANRWEHLYAQGEATPEQSIKLVRVHMDLTWKASSIEDLRLYLDQVAARPPTTTACGSAAPTWRFERVPTMKPRGGSMPASTVAGGSRGLASPLEPGRHGQPDRRCARGIKARSRRAIERVRASSRARLVLFAPK